MHEIAKFGAGLVAADLMFLFWIASAEILPVEVLGRMITPDVVLPAVIFDIALFLILVHYGWNIGKIPVLRERSYLLIAGTVFGIVGAAHLMRVFTGAELTIHEWTAPLWLSWLGTAATAYLAYMSFRLTVRRK